MSEQKATLTAKAAQFRYMVVQSAVDAAGNDPPWVHSDIYLDIGPDRVDALVAAGGGSINTFVTFDVDYFDELEGSCVALMDVEATLERLAVAEGSGRMEFEFHGPEGSDQAERLVANGALEMEVNLPAAGKAMDKVPEELPERWDDEDRLLSPSGNPHQTFIDTNVSEVQKIIEAVDLHDHLDYYPITVDDGAFSLDVGDKLGHLRGKLDGDVEGPDLKNWYKPGFEPIFDRTMDGDVQLQTTPGENGGYPLAIVQDDGDVTIRHILVEVNPE